MCPIFTQGYQVLYNFLQGAVLGVGSQSSGDLSVHPAETPVSIFSLLQIVLCPVSSQTLAGFPDAGRTVVRL